MKTTIKSVLFIFLMLLSGCDQNFICSNYPDNLAAGVPESVGMSSERLERIDKVLNQYVENKWIPGAVGIIARKGKIVYHKSFGMRDIENNDPVRIDDIYRIASMTKALTTVSVMMLYEEGAFLLDDPVSIYIPEFKNPSVLKSIDLKDTTFTARPASREITIRDLLCHTSGIGYKFAHREIRPLYEKAGVMDGIVKADVTLEQSVKALAKMPLLHDPGEKFTYGLNTDVLGYLIEVISGKKFNEFIQERLLDPLGMTDTYFYLPEEKKDRLAVVYADTKNQEMKRSDYSDFNYPVEGAKIYYSGGAGLSSTVFDYAKFLQMLLNNGHYNGTQFLGRKTIDLIKTNQVGDLRGNESFGLGFGLTTEKNFTKKLSSVGNYFWGGYFSTSYWIDPSEELIAVFFTQMQPIEHGDILDKFQVLTYQAIIK